MVIVSPLVLDQPAQVGTSRQTTLDAPILHLGSQPPASVLPAADAMGGQPASVNRARAPETAPPAPVGAVSTFRCAVGGCRSPRHNHHTGFCRDHFGVYMDRIAEHTQDIGRGRALVNCEQVQETEGLRWPA